MHTHTFTCYVNSIAQFANKYSKISQTTTQLMIAPHQNYLVNFIPDFTFSHLKTSVVYFFNIPFAAINTAGLYFQITTYRKSWNCPVDLFDKISNRPNGTNCRHFLISVNLWRLKHHKNLLGHLIELGYCLPWSGDIFVSFDAGYF